MGQFEKSNLAFNSKHTVQLPVASMSTMGFVS